MTNKIKIFVVILLFGTTSSFAIKQYMLEQLKENKKFKAPILANGKYHVVYYDQDDKTILKKAFDI